MRQTGCVSCPRDKKIHGPLSPLHSPYLSPEAKLWMTQETLCSETGNTDVLPSIL